MNRHRGIYGVGETVLDVIFKNDQPMTANPGGSVFNSMVSVGRAGFPATMMTQIGDDHVGQLVIRFLHNNGVNTDYIHIQEQSQTRLALAFLDQANDAKYQFYKDNAPVHLCPDFPTIAPNDILLLGSFFAVNPALRGEIRPLIQRVKERGAIVYYDINYRKPHAADLPQTRPFILENIALSDVVRASAEDLQVVFETQDCRLLYEQYIQPRCPLFIYTDGPHDIQVHTPELQLTFPVQPIPTVSTVGAGDSFNAGFVCGLIEEHFTQTDLAELTAAQWHTLVAHGQSFSQQVCQSMENYISKGFVFKK